MIAKTIVDDDIQQVTELNAEETKSTSEKAYEAYSSKLFADLFKEVKNNPNCKYVTYLNDLIKSGYNPEWVMAFKKVVTKSHKEIVANRILQFMDCPVAYETIIEDSDNSHKLLSVDFISSGDELYTLNDFKDYSNDIEVIDQCLEIASRKLGSKLGNHPDRKEMLERAKNNIMYSFLVRKLILGDTDSATQNFGLILNQDANTVSSAPNFDLEYCFNGNSNITERIVEFDLNFVRDKYPEVYKKFLMKVRELKSIDPQTDIPRYEMIIRDAGCTDQEDFDKMTHYIRRNIRTIDSAPLNRLLY